MSKLFFLFMLAYAVTFIAMGSADVHTKYPTRTTNAAITTKIQELLSSTSTAIKKLKIESFRDKIELYTMANEYTNNIQNAIYTVNQALPNIKNQNYNMKFSEFLVCVEDMLYELQRSIYGDSGKLQEKLATAVQLHAKLLDQYQELLKGNQGESEIFINRKMREPLNMVIWAAYKLHFQTALFSKSNKELGTYITSGMNLFEDDGKKCKVDDEDTNSELLYLVQYIIDISYEGILKLYRWMDVNNKDDQSFKTVAEVAKDLSKLCDELNALRASSLGTFDFIKQFIEIYRSRAEQIKKMAHAVKQANPGDQEYVRSVLFDSITVANTFDAELELFLNKKIPPTSQ